MSSIETFTQINSHPLLCKCFFDSEGYCEYCLNDSFLIANYEDLKQNATLEAPIKGFDEIVLQIPSRQLTSLYYLKYMREPYSVSIFHRNFLSSKKEFKATFFKVLKKANNVSLHFVEHDIELIRKFSLFTVKKFLQFQELDFSFTPELGLYSYGSSNKKAKWMSLISSEFGQIKPICLMFPAWYPKDVRIFNKLASDLNPAAVGIYCGDSTKFELLIKNVRTLRNLYLDKPLFVVSVSNPEKIRKLVKLGVNHFCINSWSIIGSEKRALDLETQTLGYDYTEIIKNCDCSICSNPVFYEEENTKDSKSRKNLHISLHNACVYRTLIRTIKRDELS